MRIVIKYLKQFIFNLIFNYGDNFTLKLQLVRWTAAGLTVAKFKARNIFYALLLLVQYRAHLDSYGLGLLLFVSCII
jgi:hypothetical protein